MSLFSRFTSAASSAVTKVSGYFAPSLLVNSPSPHLNAPAPPATQLVNNTAIPHSELEQQLSAHSADLTTDHHSLHALSPSLHPSSPPPSPPTLFHHSFDNPSPSSHSSSSSHDTDDSVTSASRKPASRKSRSRARYVNVPPPIPRHRQPAIPFSFRDWCNIPVAPQSCDDIHAANVSLSNVFQRVHTSAVFDGSFSPLTTRMGCSFI
jgi:hypothetical protein